MKKYKQNKYECISIKSFYDIDGLMDVINEEVRNLNSEEYIVIYAKRDLISELFVKLIENDYDFGYINFDKIDDMLKNEVYIMTVNNNFEVNIECAYINKKIVEHNSKIALFYTDDCKQDVIDYCLNNDMKVILFDFEDDEGYDENDCKEKTNSCKSKFTTIRVSKSKNGIPNRFSKSWYNDNNGIFSSATYSFFSDDLDLVNRISKEFDLKL